MKIYNDGTMPKKEERIRHVYLAGSSVTWLFYVGERGEVFTLVSALMTALIAFVFISGLLFED
jgi:hypothetical protein